MLDPLAQPGHEARVGAGQRIPCRSVDRSEYALRRFAANRLIRVDAAEADRSLVGFDPQEDVGCAVNVFVRNRVGLREPQVDEPGL